MNKKVIILIILGAVALVGAAGITYAWFTSSADPVTNTFATGTVNIKLNDAFPQEGISGVTPGDTYDKDVSVTNTGTADAYVRVQLMPKWQPKPDVIINSVLDINTVGLDLDLTNWVKGDNGWYYYKKILKKNEDTTLLLTGVTFDGPSIGNEYQGAAFSIDVKAEAVQASHYAFKDEWGITGVSGVHGYIPAPGVEEWQP